MALPMLVNGADCGPVNPLQGLTKRFDQDRGIQQDQFVTGRSGPSRETFRIAQQGNPLLEQEASRFFSGEGPQNGMARQAPVSSAFDMSLLHKSLPGVHAHPIHSPSQPVQLQNPQASHQTKASSWAADFLQQTRTRGTEGQASPAPQVEMANRQMTIAHSPPGVGRQWTPSSMHMMSASQFAPQTIASPSQLNINASHAQWDEHFQSLETAAAFADFSTTKQPEALSQEKQMQDPAQIRQEADDLARTAALLVESVKDEQNPKFRSSQFMKLMRGLRDGEIVVDGNDMVERSEARSESAVDVKGKGKERAVDLQSSIPIVVDPSMSTDYSQRNVPHILGQTSSQVQETANAEEQREEDPNEAYFRKDNEEYIDYWNRTTSQKDQQRETGQPFGQQNEWGALQESWDSFEATTWGGKPVAHYQFQPHNPYLNGDASQRTINHTLHTQGSLYESVLELEAQVQRDPTDARAWYDLGVKQQENEREPKAIAALSRSVELDPSHLSSWLALAISYTNDADRNTADDAIQQWMVRNPRYEALVTDYFDRAERLNGGTLDSLTQMRRHDELIRCLMSIARVGNESGEMDADVQIALAVLLNTSRDYLKAQDCFKAALSVRPDDWQLYNRVGATLANSGLAEDAFQYYYRALELNPAYIRARFNLGISCMNMRRYDEAAQYILDALIMQDSDGSVHAQDDKRGVTSSTLWDSLRTTSIHLQRNDLAELCNRRDLEGFRNQFHV